MSIKNVTYKNFRKYLLHKEILFILIVKLIVNKYNALLKNKKRRVNVFFDPSSKRSQSVPESNKRTLCSNLSKEKCLETAKRGS